MSTSMRDGEGQDSNAVAFEQAQQAGAFSELSPFAWVIFHNGEWISTARSRADAEIAARRILGLTEKDALNNYRAFSPNAHRRQ